MKNKFLLLCGIATIITISGVSYVKATTITTDFNVGVKLLGGLESLEKVQDMNFGNVLVEAGSKLLKLAPDGTVNTSLKHYGKQQPAILISTQTHSLSVETDYPYDIEISMDNNNLLSNDKSCGFVSRWNHEKFIYFDSDNNMHGGFRIGATFKSDWSDIIDDIGPNDYVDCTGTATATLIYTGIIGNENP